MAVTNNYSTDFNLLFLHPHSGNMRNYLFSFIATAFFVFPLFSFAQAPDWEWQNPLPTANDPLDIHVFDLQNAIVVGNRGTILKTTNGGQTWEQKLSNTVETLHSVSFINSQIGWAVGSQNTILRTLDGGNTWNTQNGGTAETYLEVHFYDFQNGWIAGTTGTILKTSDGGASWTPQNSGTGEHFYGLHVLNHLTAWVVGSSGIVRKTSDGGLNWVAQSSQNSGNLWSVQFIDSQTGWISTGEGKILKTVNGGTNWQTITTGTSMSLNSVHFSDAMNGWAAGGISWNTSTVLLKTTNGGLNWSIQSPIASDNLNCVFFSNPQYGWALGRGGLISKTTDWGFSWQNVTSTATKQNLYSVAFGDTASGWAVGLNGTALRTDNGGGNWKLKNVAGSRHLFSTVFCNPRVGWIFGDSGTILKTTNTGLTWQSQTSGTNKPIIASTFRDSLYGIAVGNTGEILKTTDGGSTWTVKQAKTKKPLRSVCFSDSTTIWAVGDSAIVLKSTDSGETWTKRTISGTPHYSIFFADAKHGWIVGGNGSIRKTTNGGATWTLTLYLASGGQFSSVFFRDTLTGWLTGSFSDGGGIVMKTTDGGNNWVAQYTGTQKGLNGITFNRTQKAWVVGDGGAILSTEKTYPTLPGYPFSFVNGRLFKKSGPDCETDSLAPFSNRIMKLEPGPYYSISNEKGNYTLRVPVADSLQDAIVKPVAVQNPIFQVNVVCPPPHQYTVSLDTLADTLSGKDFGFELTPCHHLEVQLASVQRRRCFESITSVTYQNLGSLSAPDAYILVEFPHWVHPVSASGNYVALNDSVWRFDLGTVAAGVSGLITITDFVPCNNIGILNLTQCTKATIYPASSCPPINWNGASLSVSGECLGNGSVRIHLWNEGTNDMTDSTSYRVYLDSILVFERRVKLAQEDSLILQVQADGRSVRFEADQVANHPTQYAVVLNVEECGLSTQNMSKGFINKFAQPQSPSSKVHCLPVIGSWDPNDKTVVPEGFTSQHVIPPGTKLEYLVRFQNTGTDTAFNVYVVDTLDGNLNPETFEMGAASHRYELSMQTSGTGKTCLRWQFNNIQLPDSGSNQVKSNGFIQFRISPKPGLSPGTQVRNKAGIYFDFNPPVITNQTLTTYNNLTFTDPALNNHVQIVTALPDNLSPKQIGVSLYPNPVTASFLTADFQIKGSILVYNAQGQAVYENQNVEGKQTLPVLLKTGFYIARLRTGKGASFVKVLVE